MSFLISKIDNHKGTKNTKKMYPIYVINVTDSDWKQYYQAKIKETYQAEPIFLSLTELEKLDNAPDKIAIVWTKDSYKSFVIEFPKSELAIANKFIAIIYLEQNRIKQDFEMPQGNADRFDIPSDWNEITTRIKSIVDYHRRQH